MAHLGSHRSHRHITLHPRSLKRIVFIILGHLDTFMITLGHLRIVLITLGHLGTILITLGFIGTF